MMVKGAWKAKVAGLFARAKKAPELSSSVVKHDRMDDGVLEDMIERARLFRDVRFNQPEVDFDSIVDADGNPIPLSDQQRERAEEYVAWGDLYDDVFRTLHTYHEPELLPEDQVKPSRELNRRIIQQLTANEEFQKLRPDTRHSPIESAFTTLSMAESLSETLTTELQEFVVRAKEMSELEEKLGPDGHPGGGVPGGGGGGGAGGGAGGGGKRKKNPIFDEKKQQPDPNATGQPDPNAPGNAPDPNAPGGPTGPQGAGPDQQALDDIAQQLADKAAQQQQQGLGTNVMNAITNALKQGQEAADAITNLPGYGEGGGTRNNPDQMIALAKKWRETPSLRNVARMTGRLQRDMRQKRARRVVGGNEEIVNVTLGDDLPLLLPHELATLRHPVLKRDFQRRYHERSLLQYETEGTDAAGRGPIVVCLDGSGSMMGARNEWARSVALALVTIARREKRDASVIEFSSGGQIAQWEFLKREKIDTEKVLDFVTHMFAGGTTIVEGLLTAQKFMQSRPEFRKADIVLIGDGGDYFNEDRDGVLRDELRLKGVRIHGVAVGMEAEQNHYFQQMCDTVVSAHDMAGSNEATDHLAEAIA